MKYIVLCLFALTFVTTSCDDFLDITPDGQVKRDPLLSTAEGIEDAMYGVYSQMRSTSLYGQELYFSANMRGLPNKSHSMVGIGI